ncbi:MFS transporter [Cystobacter fuscus]|uniref:MFS transporter n=1 Tax=Cystobacter fuscus TaxID=43 RepID=UPI002B2DC116|nr:MFS transporter [Cystobacter fuscus]
MSAHPPWPGRWLRLARLGSILLVLSVSLGGVVYVGFHEACRGYARLQFERLAAQGAIIKGPVEMLLRVGVALEQFTGFTNLARALREADPALERIRIIDARGNLLFSEPPSRQPVEDRAPIFSNKRIEILEDARSFHVRLPLEDRFETVGHLELVLPREVVTQRVEQRFQPLFTLLGACILLQGVILYATQRLWLRRARRWLGLFLGVSFLGMALVTTLALADIYSEGLRQGTSSRAHSLARRLNEAARLGLTLADVRGLDTLLREYQRSNGDLGSLALIADERVLIHTDASQSGARRESARERFDYAIDLELTDGPWNTPVRLEVSAATGALHVRLWRSCRNFLLLFVSLGLLGLLLLNALTALPRPGARQVGFEHRAVARLRPLAFFGCFLEGLQLTFLSGYVESLGARQGLPPGSAALLTIAFWGTYALATLPTEHYARGAGLKRLLVAALGLSSVPVFLMALTGDLRLLLLLRCLSGLGQGVLAGATQAYLVAAFRPEHPPRGTSLLNPAQYGGLFCGTAIGALLATHLGSREVFLLGGACGLIALAYALTLLPPLEALEKPTTPLLRRASLVRVPSVARTWRAWAHHQATLFVGLPTMLIRGGAICFAVPLLLANKGYDPDRIGHLLALHALGVLLSNQLLTALPRGSGWTRRLLQGGMAGSGLGLLALGAVNALGAWVSPETLAALAVALLGLSQGLIHAPLEDYLVSVQDGVSAKRASLSLNRFIGALGKSLGPLLVSALLLVQPEPSQALGGLGVMALLLGACFSWTSRSPRGHEVRHV